MCYDGMVSDQGTPARIGISGKMRSGKDTVAGFLLDYGFVRYAFADRMKELAAELFGMDPDVKDRPLLLSLGRRLCQVDKDVWVKHILRTMPAGARVVVSDLRFPNELELLRAAGFYIARVECPLWLRMRRLRMGRVGQEWHDELLTDPSETALDGSWGEWNFVLNGGDTMATLKEEVRAMAEVMLAGEDQ